MGGTLTDRRNSMVKFSKRGIDESFGDDLELGGIEVTREVEVVSAYKEAGHVAADAGVRGLAAARRDEPAPHFLLQQRVLLQDFFAKSNQEPRVMVGGGQQPADAADGRLTLHNL